MNRSITTSGRDSGLPDAGRSQNTGASGSHLIAGAAVPGVLPHLRGTFCTDTTERPLYRRLGKNRPLCLEFSRRGITGVMPRARAAARFASLSYPLSVIAMRGRISGPMSSEVSNCVLSLASPPVRWKSSGLPSRSVLRWILVEKPPRERPNAWRCCPLLRPRPKRGRALSCCRRIGPGVRSGCIRPATGRMPRIRRHG